MGVYSPRFVRGIHFPDLYPGVFSPHALSVFTHQMFFVIGVSPHQSLFACRSSFHRTPSGGQGWHSVRLMNSSYHYLAALIILHQVSRRALRNLLRLGRECPEKYSKCVTRHGNHFGRHRSSRGEKNFFFKEKSSPAFVGFKK